MRISRVSALTGRKHSMDLPVTNEQLAEWLNGSPVQQVMPHLSPEEREFLISGTTPQEWNDFFDEVKEGED